MPPDVLKAIVDSGKVYGVPSVRGWAADDGVVIRKDIVDKYKIDLTNPYCPGLPPGDG